MQHTPNFNLNLPEGGDNVKISDLNENFNIIDRNMGGGTGSDVFVINYDEETGEPDKTFDELLAAYDANKTIKAMNGPVQLQIGYCNSIAGGAYLYTIVPDTSGLLYIYLYHNTDNTVNVNTVTVSGERQ
jgi:hypothetical protein